MRKRYVSDLELNQIIKLKQAGASWLKIQNQTGVPRRSAHNAYEDWQRSQSIDELKAARVDIAAEEFRKHVDLLIKVADSIVESLEVPETPKMKIGAQGLLYSFWEKSYRELQNYQPGQTIEDRERKRFIREYEMLFKSLQYHTQEKVRWEVLEEWKKYWDSNIKHLKRFEKEVGMVAASIRNKDLNLVNIINKQGGQEKIEDRMAQVVLDIIWQKIIDGTLDPESPEISINYIGVDKSVPAYVNKDLFEEIAAILNQVAEEFCTERKEDIIQPTIDDVKGTKKAIVELEEMLSPLVLRPLILRTRCDLCPA